MRVGLGEVRKLFVLFQGEFSGEALAIGGQAGRLQDIALVRRRLEGEIELVGPDEIAPVVVICGGIGEVEVGPNHDPFALGLGGALNVLIQLKAKDARRFYLTAERIEQADVRVYLRLGGAVGADEFSQRHNVDSDRGVVCIKGHLQAVIVYRRRFGVLRRLTTGIGQQSYKEEHL